jgi:hypothetical protein
MLLPILLVCSSAFSCDREPTDWYMENVARKVNTYAAKSDAIALAIITSKKIEARYTNVHGRMTRDEDIIVRAKIIGGWGKVVKPSFKATNSSMNAAIQCFGNNIHAYVSPNDLYYFFYENGLLIFAIRADIARREGYTKLDGLDYRKI